MVGLVCANDKNAPYCTVFVGYLLRKDARKSAAESLACRPGGARSAERGNEKGQILRSGLSYELVRLAGIEPTTPWFVAKYSIQLSYSRPEARIIAANCGFAKGNGARSREFQEDKEKAVFA
jgi:hypothetical protein